MRLLTTAGVFCCLFVYFIRVMWSFYNVKTILPGLHTKTNKAFYMKVDTEILQISNVNKFKKPSMKPEKGS